MKVYKALDQLPHLERPVLTIGSFDGVHIGHQQILQQIKHLAASIQGTSVVITFHPHPRLVLSKYTAPVQLLNTLDEKAALLERYGIDALVVVPFSKAFASQSPDAYIQDFLVRYFKPSIIAIGYDHKFGKDRQGDIAYLRKFQVTYNFEVVEISKQEVADMTVSSTKIRQALQDGAVGKAHQLSGHPFRLTGKVAKGLQIGTTIGFPTANLEVEEPNKLIPPAGIYAVKVYHEEHCYQGMLYIGDRPTIDEGLQQTIEVNIFDFNQDIYGATLKVDFMAHLREDAKFETLDQLKDQLKADKVAALAALAKI